MHEIKGLNQMQDLVEVRRAFSINLNFLFYNKDDMCWLANIEVRPVKNGTVSFKAPMQRECIVLVCFFHFLGKCVFGIFFIFTRPFSVMVKW